MICISGVHDLHIWWVLTLKSRITDYLYGICFHSHVAAFENRPVDGTRVSPTTRPVRHSSFVLVALFSSLIHYSFIEAACVCVCEQLSAFG